MIKAILCDLDDTIIAFDSISEQYWLKTCYRFVSRIDGLEANRLFKTIQESRVWYWSDPVRSSQGRHSLIKVRRDVVTEAFTRLGINDAALANEMADWYSVERDKAAYLLPGAIKTINHLRNQRYRLAIVTNGNSDYQRNKIERFGLVHLFDYILIEGEFGFGKPDERVFLHVLEKLEVTPQESWMIGDNLEHDVGGAQKVGIFGIWVDWRGTGLPESTTVRPDIIITKLSDLLTKI